ncbi:aminotransferase class V-fold PLP-dependent enzyme [Phaeospirillum tilakii]|uniref:Aminotransferase class V-fold PLP-dependent enzyme n=1 Tax=Phaeospirillum tilakii TaxID=741673 RepID=A0ABW5C8H3_9PROT
MIASRRQFLCGGGAALLPLLVADTALAKPAPPNKWAALRGRFSFLPGLTYLNSGSEGSLPTALRARLSHLVTEWSASPSWACFSSPNLEQSQTQNRRRLAEFVSAPPADVVITDNTTMGLAMVVLGLPFTAGDEVIITDHEHYALTSPLKVASLRSGIVVKQVAIPSPATSAAQILDVFTAALTPRTRAICFSHVNWTTGLRMPVEAICALGRQHNVPTLVDGAHGLGMIDLNLPALGCDFYACAGHKWLNGPPATGLLYIRDAVTNPWKLVPIVSEVAEYLGPKFSIADALQMRGSPNGPGFAILAAMCDFYDEIGKSAVESRILSLAATVKARAAATWGEACVYSPSPAVMDLSSGLSAFVPSRDPTAAYDADFVPKLAETLINKHKIWVRATSFPSPPGAPAPRINTLRVSTNIFNNTADIDRLFAALTHEVG